MQSQGVNAVKQLTELSLMISSGRKEQTDHGSFSQGGKVYKKAFVHFLTGHNRMALVTLLNNCLSHPPTN